MHVLLNRFVTLGQRTGIGHYAAELLRCVGEQAPGVVDCFPTDVTWRLGHLWARVRPLLLRGERARSDAASGPRSAWSALRHKAIDALRGLGRAYLGRQLRQALARRRYDLYHEPNMIPLPCDQRTVTTIHDLSVLLHPEWHPRARVKYFEKHFVSSLPRSDHFMAISESTRREVIDVLGIRPERVTRVYMGVRPDLGPQPPATTAAALRRLGLPPRYLLHVGTLEPRKNLLMLLRAYCALPDPLRQGCPLLLVGNWGWSSDDIEAYYESEGKHRGVVKAGYIPDGDLGAVYNGARALVYPTFYEGFGLPPVEMLACGGAVLGSTATAVAEVVGPHARLIDPHDADGWRDAMARVIADDDWCATLRRGGGRHFTWDACAADTLAVYRKVCGAARLRAA